MALDQGPVVLSAILRNALIRLRKESRLTQESVADQLEWSTSKLIRVEVGRSGITKTDLDALLTVYGVSSDDGEREYLQNLNRGTRENAWWSDYKNEISAPYLNFVGFEAGASFVRQFVTNVIPGLLQTEDYATVLTESTIEAVKVRPVVNLRLQRQRELAQRSDKPYEYYVLDEAAIRRQIGIKKDPTIMPAQLRHIAGLAEREERVIIRVIPFSEGAHAGLNVAGSFTLLEFDGGLPDLVYLDAGRGDVASITGDDPSVSIYRALFESLLEPALTEAKSIAFMRDVAEEMS